MAVHLTVSKIQRQKWTGVILPPLAGIKVKGKGVWGRFEE